MRVKTMKSSTKVEENFNKNKPVLSAKWFPGKC